MAFDIYTGLPQQPMAGGGLLPSTAPPQVPQGPGLLPLLAGALGTIAGGNRFGHGFLGGLGMAQNQQQQQFQNQMGQYRLQEQARAAQAQRAQAEAAAAAKQAQQQQERQAIFQAAVAQGMPEDQAMAIANSQTLGKAFAAEAFKPEKPVGPAGFQAWQQDNPGGTFEQFMRVQASIDPRGTNISIAPQGQLSVRPLSQQEQASLNMSPEQASGLMVDAKGNVVPKPQPRQPELTPQQKVKMAGEQARITKQAALDVATQTLPIAFDAYKQAAQAYQEASIFGGLSPITAGEAAQRAEDARRNLVRQIAIRESGGAEPNPSAVKDVEARVPDFAGFKDAPRFESRIEDLRRLQGQGGAAQSPKAPQQQSFAGGNRSKADILSQYGITN